MSLETKIDGKATLQDVLDFINNCNYISVVPREGGYKIFCYLSESDKWNSPNCTIWVTDTKLPEMKHDVTVDYRKEIIFSSTSEEIVNNIIEKIRNRSTEIQESKQKELNQEFINHSKTKMQ